MTPVRHFWKLLLLGMLLAISAGALHAQGAFSLEAGPMQKKEIHERFLRLVRGGDGYYYALKGNSGHYWNFGAEGERGVEVIRLNPALEPVDSLKLRTWGAHRACKIVNEVVVAPDGIGLLSIRKEPGELPKLQLCRPTFQQGAATLACEKLADMPGLSIGLHKPCLRVVYSPDSSHILLAWRSLSEEGESDRSLTCLVLNRDLEVVVPQFWPFKQLDTEIWVKEALLLDEAHVVFSAQTLRPGNNLLGPSTIAYGILHYSIAEQELRSIRFRNTREVPVETRLGLAADGALLAAGWYLDQQPEGCMAGTFIGRITGADSLVDLHMYPFEAAMRDALVRREKKSGALGIRTGFHSAFLSSAAGHAYILHLRGEVDEGFQPIAPGKFANNTLHCWTYGRNFEYYEHTLTGFNNHGREEYFETFSWRPLLVGGQWHALATDYSRIQNESKPTEAQTFLWHLPGNDFAQLSVPAGCVLAPRAIVRDGENAWVGIAISGKRWRMVRIAHTGLGSQD